MTTMKEMIRRNTKLFFKDKGLFFTSLITPVILLVLYATFLMNIYRDSFLAFMPEGLVPEELLDAAVVAQLVSSLLAVSCVTVSFCSNMLMVNDKMNGAFADLTVTPVKRSALSLSYYFSTLISTVIISVFALAVCLVYMAVVGWYLSFTDVLLLLADVLLLVMFGTGLSSVVNYFLRSQGQVSAVGTIVSSGYGFICGAYMPISAFSDGLAKVIMFLPGTYGTSLLRNHAFAGVVRKMRAIGLPEELVDGVLASVDCNIYFFDNKVSIGAMFAVIGISVLVLTGAYVLINVLSGKKR